MSYVVYDKSTSAIVKNVRYRPYRVTQSYKTMAAAQAAVTRASNEYWSKFGQTPDYDVNQDPKFLYGVSEYEYYTKHIEKQVQRKNLLTGKTFYESVNTPHYCSPSSETYWSM